MSSFDPSRTISADYGIFGIPVEESEARLVLVPVPWDVTTSYGKGASDGPELIRQESVQIDLFDLETGKSFEQGYFMKEIPDNLKQLNQINRARAEQIIEWVSEIEPDQKKIETVQKEVNKACQEMVDWVYQQSKSILDRGQLLGLVGGDHSTPFGAIRAVSEKEKGDFGILHIDAHADLRDQYQGFRYSHASIMNNVMTSNFAPKKLVQVGIRDFSEEEYEFIQKSQGKIKTYFDIPMKRRLLKGEPWSQLAEEIIEELPKNVYISFDIDGLDPALCPHTGTPVAGGLSLDQVFYLFYRLAESGRRLVGFDLNEVSSGGQSIKPAWDGNVGARVLYKLCGWSVKTNPH